jgi:signal transduction histidine kinase
MDGSDAPVEERLRASRARLLAGSDTGRRELERALHDGVQLDLVALGVNLQHARRTVDSDPVAATALLEEMLRDVHAALDGVRALAERVYPALLPSRGLVDALRAAASAAGISLGLDATGIARYSAGVEAAAYFCCRAAFESAAPTTGSIRCEDDTLRVELAVDAGRYETPDDLRDRVDALGGRVTVETREDGAYLCVDVPLYEASSAR